MQQSTERDISVAFQRLSITPETRKHGNELKELTTPFKTKIYTAIEILRKEKKKRPDTKSIFEYLKKNDEIADISENQVEEYLNQMIKLNLIFNKKTDQGLDSFYKTTEKSEEIPLDLSYLTESNHSNIGEENSQYDLSEILSQPAIPIEQNIQTPSIQSTQNVPTETVNEQLIWKIEAQLSALKSLVNCEISIIDKRLNTFSDTLNHVLKNLEVSQNSNTDLLKENVEYLKKELNSKDELIKSLVDTQTAILETIGKSKRNEEKRHLQVETSPILTPLQQDNQSHHKNTIYVGNLDSNVSIEGIYELFGLKSTAYLRSNCHVDFPLNQQTQKTRGHVYITAPKHVFDELVKLNGVEFKGKFLIIENAKVRPKVTNPNLTNFPSPNRFEPLTFEKNIPDLGNDIDHNKVSDMQTKRGQ